VLHLTALNDHIVTIQSMRSLGLVKLRADRVATPPVTRDRLGADAVRAVSISAFAFQGTNAHAIVAASSSDRRRELSRTPDAGFMLWDAKRLWIGPPAHPFLSSANTLTSAQHPAVFIHARIGAAASQAYLWDHRVSGRALFPAAGFIELATAATRGTASSTSSGLRDIIIPSPLLLGRKAGIAASEDAVEIVCELALMSGDVVISTSGVVHVRTTSTYIVDVRTSPGSPLALTAAASCLAIGSDSERDATGDVASFIARLASPGNSAQGGGGENAALWMPPAVLDANLQLGGAQRVSASSNDVYIPAAIQGYVAPSTPAAAASTDTFGVARLHAASGADAAAGALRSSHAIASDAGIGLSVLSGLELKRMKLGGTANGGVQITSAVAAAAESAALRRRAMEMAPLYSVVHQAIAPQPVIHDETSDGVVSWRAARRLVNVTNGHSDPLSTIVAGACHSAKRRASAGLETVQHLSSANATTTARVHCVASCGALQGVVHCAAEEMGGSSAVGITLASNDAFTATDGARVPAVAAIDTFGTAVVAGVTRVGRLTVSDSSVTAAPLLGRLLATTLTDGVSRLMTSRLADTLIHALNRTTRAAGAAASANAVDSGGSGAMPSALITGRGFLQSHFSTPVCTFEVEMCNLLATIPEAT
jgi:hypothetical protein